jgi:peptide/nickel transport system substrate-binding protein
MDLVANPDWYGDPPKTAKIIIKYFADATTMRLALENGEIDVALKSLNPTDYADLRGNPNLQVIEGPGAQIRYLCFNHTIEPYSNAKVRQAISYAVDRKAIADKAFQGTHQPLYSMVPMGMWSHINAFPKRDLDKAKALLSEAGYSADNPLEIDLWWTPTHYGDTESDVAAVVKEALEETGMIKVTLQSAEWATYIDQLGSMGFFLLGWYPDYLDPDNYTYSFAASDASDDIGISYSSEQMDSYFKAEQTAADLRGADREKVFEDIQNLWVTDVPTIPLTQGTLLVAAQKNVSGIVLDPNMLTHLFLLEKK